MRAVAALATVQFLIAGAALVNEYVKFCAGCAERGSVPIAAAGVAFYLHLAVMAWLGRKESVVRGLAFVALGAHCAMAMFQLQQSMDCKICWFAFGGSALLALAALLTYGSKSHAPLAEFGSNRSSLGETAKQFFDPVSDAEAIGKAADVVPSIVGVFLNPARVAFRLFLSKLPTSLGVFVLTWPVGAAIACTALPLLIPTGTEVRADEGAQAPETVAPADAGEIVVFVDLRCRRCAAFMKYEAEKLEADYVATGLATMRYAIVDPQNAMYIPAIRLAYGAAADGRAREAINAFLDSPTLAFDVRSVTDRLSKILPAERLMLLADRDDVIARMNGDFAWAKQLKITRTPTIFARPAGTRSGKVLARWRTIGDMLVFVDQSVRRKK